MRVGIRGLLNRCIVEGEHGTHFGRSEKELKAPDIEFKR